MPLNSPLQKRGELDPEELEPPPLGDSGTVPNIRPLPPIEGKQGYFRAVKCFVKVALILGNRRNILVGILVEILGLLKVFDAQSGMEPTANFH